MCPMLQEGVLLGTFTAPDGEPDGFFAENAQGDTFEISEELYHILSRANGTFDFYQWDMPREYIDRVIRQLKKRRIITTSRLQPDFPFSRLVLFLFGERVEFLCGPCSWLNRVLPYLCVFLFCMGVPSFPDAVGRFSIVSLLPAILLLLLSMALHEAGHMCAILAYGGQIADAGLLLLGILPVGAYIGNTVPPNDRRSHKIQISLAGVEVNLGLTGLFTLLSGLSGAAGQTFAVAAVWNLSLALVNLLPTAGLDGEQALSALLGLPSFSKFAADALRNPRARRMLLHGGPEGFFWLAVCIAQILCRLLLALLFAAALLGPLLLTGR